MYFFLIVDSLLKCCSWRKLTLINLEKRRYIPHYGYDKDLKGYRCDSDMHSVIGGSLKIHEQSL